MAWVATGSMVRTALDAVASRWPDSAVWSAPSLKPIDAEAVTAICRGHRVVVTLEEHSVAGGLGSATGLTEQLAAFGRGEYFDADPWVLLVCPSVVDPGRAPAGASW